MGWSIGYDSNWKRDIGYGVPCQCDLPGCSEQIDRGLAYVCGTHPRGGSRGCGLYFCPEHLKYRRIEGEYIQLCPRCYRRPGLKAYDPKPDIPLWINHKLKDPSWAEWRAENPDWVAAHKARRKKREPVT
jgi:hypothetical protein